MSDISKHLRCTDCGIGRPIGGSLHTAAECRDNLRNALDEAEAERDNLRFNYGQALADADHHKQESEIHHAAFIEAFDRATKAEAERDEARAQAAAMHRRAQAAEGEAVRVRNAYALPACCADAARARDAAEAERDALLVQISEACEMLGEGTDPDTWTLRDYVTRMVDRAAAAEAEVARLRGEYERGLREAAGVCEALAEEALRVAESPSMHLDSASRYAARVRSLRAARERILALLDAPAAEVSDG